jgi:DNA-binding NarL/FixJ family response regulator
VRIETKPTGALAFADAAERSEIASIFPTGVDRLTSREQEVLHYLAAGHTDREIAQALFVSRRTVNTHVAVILSKFGARSRAEAAVRAVRAGLV